MGNISTIVVTLSPVVADVKITGTIDAYGSVGVYLGQTFDAAMFGPAGTDFTISNRGVIESAGTSTLGAGILLGSAGTVLNDGGIRAGTGIEMLGDAPGLVNNKSEIDATLGNGVYLQGAGTVETTGLITAAQTGIELAQGGYAYNSGKILGTIGIAAGGGAGSYVYNRGAVTASTGAGILLSANGAISNAGHVNAAGGGLVLEGGGLAYNFGTIKAEGVGISATAGGVYNYKTAMIAGAPYGVSIGGGGYVYNAGTIIGKASGSFGAGVAFADGGYLYNAAGGTLTGAAGVVGGDAALTVVNAGLIGATGGFAAIMLTAGGTVTNVGIIDGATGVFFANGTASAEITNDFIIAGSGPTGIYFAGGGTLLNHSLGQISGFQVGVSAGANATIINAGLISENDALDFPVTGYGVKLGAASYLQNSGEIYGYSAAIYMRLGGSIMNEGLIKGYHIDGNARTNGIIFGGGIIVNDGTIDAGATAVSLTAAGTIINKGDIIGATAILAASGSTIINAGLIAASATNHYAVSMASGSGNDLIIVPGATVIGELFGGGGVMDLASASSSGFLKLGNTIAGFDEITIDTGANWVIVDTTALGSSVLLDNEGTLHASGMAGLTITGALSGNGTIDLGAGGLTLDGSVAAGQRIKFKGAGETLRIGDPAEFAGTVENFAQGDTIELTGVAKNLVDGISFSHGVLTVSEAFSSYNITLSNPASFAGEKFKVFRDHGETGITLVSNAKMAFLAPLTPTEGDKTLPALGSHYSGNIAILDPPGAATNDVTVSAGWIAHDLMKPAAGFVPLTIHV